MIFAKNVEITVRNNKVVLANSLNGKWMRISEEVYEILKSVIREKKDIKDLRECFEQQEDYDFIKRVYDHLTDMDILVNAGQNQMFPNKLAGIQLTNCCNLRCIHCCVDAGDNIGMGEMSTEEMKKTFDKVIRWKPMRVMLSGGEPMMRKDFMQLLVYLRNSYDEKITLSTNALLINKNNVEELVRCCDNFDISIDGADEESCAMVRGKGVFEEVIKRVVLLKENGAQKISLSMAMADKNEYLAEAFYKLNDELGTFPVCRKFSPVGRGEENKSYFTAKDETDVYIPAEFLVDDYKKPFGVCTCAAGNKEIIIGCDGKVYPCPQFWDEDHLLGDITKCDSVEELIKAEEDNRACPCVAKNMPQDLPQCRDCSVRSFCWTCPGEMNEIKTKEAFEKRCKIIKPLLIKRVWESSYNFDE